MNKLLLALLLFSPSVLMAQEWVSNATRTDVVELFTSEGCSSCPPADHWLSSLKDRPGLFSTFIPMAFHVDYWDYIGWKDPFAKPAYSQRQRQYVKEGSVSQSYTPGIVINSKEWRPWFSGKRTWAESTQNAGILQARLDDDGQLSVAFTGEGAAQLHVALLGMGLKTEVKAGENRGRELPHDFVVLNVRTMTGDKEWALDLPAAPDLGQQRVAIAAWVTPENSQTILQATGGYLDKPKPDDHLDVVQ